MQPEWSPTGELHFVSDRTDWANLYQWRNGEAEAEFARSNWRVGMCSYGFDSPHSLICSYSQREHWSLARISLDDKRLTPIEFPCW